MSRAARASLVVVIAALGAAACGELAFTPDGGSDGAADAGWTQCSSPDGFQVCGEFVNCPPCANQSKCEQTLVYAKVRLCDYEPLLEITKYPCFGGARDGNLCIAFDEGPSATSGPNGFYNGPDTLARLLAQNGAAYRVRFGDMSAYSLDASTPLPTQCPNFMTTQACGGSCGPCKAGLDCVGRGPLHPTGWCKVPYTPNCKDRPSGDGGYVSTCEDADRSCFIYDVQPEVQRAARIYGVCIPTPMCEELAKSLPGGASCTR